MLSFFVPSRFRGHKKLPYVIYLNRRLGRILQDRIAFHNLSHVKTAVERPFKAAMPAFERAFRDTVRPAAEPPA